MTNISTAKFITRAAINEVASVSAASQPARMPPQDGAASAPPVPPAKFTPRSVLNQTSAVAPSSMGTLLQAQETTLQPRAATSSPAQKVAPIGTEANAAPVNAPIPTTEDRAAAAKLSAELGILEAPGKNTTAQVTDEQVSIFAKAIARTAPANTASSGEAKVEGLENAPTGKPVEERSANFAFGTTEGGYSRWVANFKLSFEGLGVDVKSALESGKLQVDVRKWGGLGNVGPDAKPLALHGSRYTFNTFQDGIGGTANNRISAYEDSAYGTFGGFTATGGVTITLRSYDQSMNLSGAKLSMNAQ